MVMRLATPLADCQTNFTMFSNGPCKASLLSTYDPAGDTMLVHWIIEDIVMIKKLTKHGNSYALVIDKPVLDLLKIEPGTPLEITTDGQTLVVSPARDPKRKAKFQAALKESNRRYGRALKRLAD